MSESDESFRDRHAWDFGTWPEYDQHLHVLQETAFPAPPGIAINLMVFTVASRAAGCLHCQAHGSFGLHHLGAVPIEKVAALWSWERSDLFDDRERAALDFGFAAGQAPNAVSPAHHAALRKHYSDQECRTLLRVVALSGMMNRFNDSLAVVTDDAARDWAAEHLGGVGWIPGKHLGADHERRADLPIGTA